MNSIEFLDASDIIINLGDDNNKLGGKTVMVLGCGGFLGTLLLNYLEVLNSAVLKDNPVKVIGMDNYMIGNSPKTYEDPNFKIWHHDVCHPFNANELPKINYIFNFCGIADPAVYSKFPKETAAISYTGTINVFELALVHKVESLLVFSSSEIYGDPDESHIPTKEDYNGNVSTTGERACYDEFKRCIETLSDIYHRVNGLPVKVVRPFNVFAPGMSLRDKRVLPSYVKKMLNNEKLQVYGHGTETRTFCYGSDFMTGLMQLLFSNYNGQIFNLGNSDNEISMIDLAHMVEAAAGKTDMVELVEPPAVYKKQPQRRCPDITKAKNLLGYAPKISLKSGIEWYYEWAKEANKL